MRKKSEGEVKTSKTVSVYPSWITGTEKRFGSMTNFITHYYAIDEMLRSGDVKGAVNKLKEKSIVNNDK